MRSEFAKWEIKTSVFSGRKSQAGNCCLPEELADRVGRLERECFDLRRATRHMKQFSGLTAVVAVVMTMSGASLS